MHQATDAAAAAAKVPGDAAASAEPSSRCGEPGRTVAGIVDAVRRKVARSAAPSNRTGAEGPRSSAPRSSREARRGYRDPLRDHRAVVGLDTRTPWYVRVRSVIVLALIVAALGVGLAVATLVLIASGRVLLEILAG